MRSSSKGSMTMRPASISARIVRSLSTTARRVYWPTRSLPGMAANSAKKVLKFPSVVPIRTLRMEMEHPEEQTHFVKRVVLPSGKTIEVVYFKDATDTAAPVQKTLPHAEPNQNLRLCLDCSGELVYPVEWEESGPENWSVL